jgi:hypothetical protein
MPAQVRREGITWARPWLGQPREAIDAYVRRHRLSHVEDDSNADARFARNRLRLEVWPALVAAVSRGRGVARRSGRPGAGGRRRAGRSRRDRPRDRLHRRAGSRHRRMACSVARAAGQCAARLAAPCDGPIRPGDARRAALARATAARVDALARGGERAAQLPRPPAPRSDGPGQRGAGRAADPRRRGGDHPRPAPARDARSSRVGRIDRSEPGAGGGIALSTALRCRCASADPATVSRPASAALRAA